SRRARPHVQRHGTTGARGRGDSGRRQGLRREALRRQPCARSGQASSRVITSNPAPAPPWAAQAPLSVRELDALREVANIGAAHAATALSTMIGSTIMISVPQVNVMRLQDVPPVVSTQEEPVVAVLLQMLGDLSGRTLLVFPCAVAVRLAELLLHREPSGSTQLGALEESAIQEVGNILSSAYMNALSDFMGMMLLPSPPKLSIDASASVLAATH